MKKFIAIVMTVIVLVSAPIAASVAFPRQVDPDSAPPDAVYGQGLYLFYGSIVALVSSGNFTAARHLIHQSGFIHIPPEISDAINTFNRLVNSTANLFSTIHLQLANASNYLATGRLELARENVTQAVLNLRTANLTLSQLFGAAPQLAAITGIPSSLFLQKLQPLKTTYNSYVAEANRLTQQITGASKLYQTSVTLAVAPSAFVTGSVVTVDGHLSSSSGPLASRSVSVYFGGGELGQALTNASGNFSAELRTPYYYGGSASAFASFLPAGNDTLVFAPSTSVPVRLNVTFSSPTFSLAVPRSVLAGQHLRVNGTLSFGGNPLSGYQVSLSGFKLKTAGRTTANGSFSFEFAVPSGVGQGTYPFVFQTIGNQTIGPLTSQFLVFVVEEDPSVVLDVPPIAFAGLPMTVSGTAVANGTGLVGARVLNTSPSPLVDVTSSAGGGFSFAVTPPLTTPNGGWGYTVEVYPRQTWVLPSPVAINVFVINPLVLVFPASSLGLLLLVVRRRRPKGETSIPKPSEEPKTLETAAVRPLPTGLTATYAAAAELVARHTALVILPQQTIREYLEAVRGRMKGFDHFENISSAVESYLYGEGGSLESEASAEAELLALRGALET